MRIGSLFSGAGGLDLAVEEVFGGETIWHSEVDRAASRVLAYRWPGVPNLGSITEIDWTSVEPVDVLCGGFPCQDVSAAGKRAGIKDGTRSGLWAVFAEAIDALRPQYVVIENVRGLLSAAAHRTVEDDAGDYLEPDPAGMGDGAGRPVLRAAGAVLGDLADLGYDAQWATLAAAAVGAPHRRERVFILASHAECGGGAGSAVTGGYSAADSEGRQTVLAGRRGSGLADSSGYGWDEGRPESAGIVGGFDAAVSGDEPGGAFIVADSSSAAVWESAGSASAEETRSQSGDRPGDCGGERTPRDGRQACVCGCRRIDHDWGAHPDRFDDGGCRRCRCESFWPADEPGVALLPTPVVTDAMGARNSTAWRSNPDHGISIGDTLTDAMWKLAAERGEMELPTGPTRGGGDEPGVALLPTPTAQCAKHGAESRFGGGNGDGSNLWQIAHLLPTPRNRDGKGATASRSGDNKHDLPSALAAAPDDDEPELWPVIRNAIGYEYGRQRSNGMSPMFADDIDLDGLANAATEAVKDLPSPLRAQGKADSTGKPPESGLGSLPLLPTPASADGQRGQDFARANQEGSGGDDLVTLAVKADRNSAWGKYEPAIRRWEAIVGPAPAPTEPNKNGNPRLSAAFSEWLMGWPAGWVTDPHIGISRNDQLRIIGNGVCPQQAAAALHYLLTVSEAAR